MSEAIPPEEQRKWDDFSRVINIEVMPDDIQLKGRLSEADAGILPPEALRFIAALSRRFEERRREILSRRVIRQRQIDAGRFPDFLPETASIRDLEWKAAALPPWMKEWEAQVVADFEDGTSPLWEKIVQGHINLRDAAGKITSAVEPRGWHLVEKHLWVDGKPVSASIFDSGLFLFHSARRLLEAGAGPFLFLPKLEQQIEARLWNDLFSDMENLLAIPPGSVRTAVLIETVPAVLEADEILWELKNRCAGLVFGKKNYLFSIIKTFQNHPDFILPAYPDISGREPFFENCEKLLAQICRRRGVAAAVWDGLRQSRFLPQTSEPLPALVTAHELLRVPKGQVTEEQLRFCVRIGLFSLESWLRGAGPAVIDGRLENIASAEVCRCQLWQWVRHKTVTVEGQAVTRQRIAHLLQKEIDAIQATEDRSKTAIGQAATLFVKCITDPILPEFLTIAGYDFLKSAP
ncbi:MAG: hypothetical protein NC819_00615 [Candidatus Omnitrophica bacterium]|nr:hypothetical protein [Candidatus Omnitrophota bacterium]